MRIASTYSSKSIFRMDCADLSHLCETTRFSSDMSISGRVVACRWHDLLRERRSLFFRMDCLADALAAFIDVDKAFPCLRSV